MYYYDSPMGVIKLCADEESLLGIWFDDVNCRPVLQQCSEFFALNHSIQTLSTINSFC